MVVVAVALALLLEWPRVKAVKRQIPFTDEVRPPQI